MKQVLRVVFVCSLVFLAAAPAAVARTATLGWVAQSSPTTSRLTAVSAADAHDVWAVGASSTLLATTTGGSAWQVGTDPSAYAGSEYFYDVAAVAPGVCWAVGANGIILKDTAGSDWVQQTSPSPNGLAGVTAVTQRTPDMRRLGTRARHRRRRYEINRADVGLQSRGRPAA